MYKKVATHLGIYISIFIFVILGIKPVSAANTNFAPPITKKVVVINYDPTIFVPNTGRIKLSQYQSTYNSNLTPAQLVDDYITHIKRNSGNYLNYQITEYYDLDEFPPQCDQSGYDCISNANFQFNKDTFYKCLQAQTAQERKDFCHDPNTARYTEILDTYDLCGKSNRGEVDEVWIMGRFWLGFWEAAMAGRDAFNINGNIFRNVSCTKKLPIMGFSYQRDTSEMLHNFDHRTESTMGKLLGWNFAGVNKNTPPITLFDKFTVRYTDVPNTPSCGNTHGHLNSGESYSYSINNSVQSSCDDWLNYPNLTGQTQETNCSTWGCTSLGFQDYWQSHLPKFTGIVDGVWNNWWKYMADWDAAIAPVSMPKGNHDLAEGASCSVSGWSCDENNYEKTINVTFYDENNTQVGTIQASENRSDLSGVCGGKTAHGFRYVFPQGSSINDGTTHTIKVVANDIDLSGNRTGENKVLDSSLKQINCSDDPTPTATPTLLASTPTIVPTRQTVQCKGENIGCNSTTDCCGGLSCNTTAKGKLCKKTSTSNPTAAPTSGVTNQCKGENQQCGGSAICCSGFSCETTPKGNLCKKTSAPIAPTSTSNPTAIPTAVVNTQCKNENVQCGQSSECCGGLTCRLTGRGTTMCKKP